MTNSPLTTHQAAALVGLNPQTLRKAAQAGKLPAQKFGRDWLFTAADVQAFAALPRKEGWPKGKPRGKRAA